MQTASFAAIGECMIELSGRGGDLWRMGFAGDTFNAAWYARAVLPEERAVCYVTAVGDDPLSEKLRTFISASGVLTDRIRTVAWRRPGLYAITLTGAERTFSYWRGESAARELAEDPAWLDEALAGVELIYFSGITLAILPALPREALMTALAKRRGGGARIAFDPNFRPALWPDRSEARAAMTAAYGVSDVVLPTFTDEAELFADASATATAERIAAAGVDEIVVKNGSEPCLIVAGGRSETVAAVQPRDIVDTTGAGDSFCGAYLAARLMGMAPVRAARLGHDVAAQVIGVRGALTHIELGEALQRDETPLP